MKTLAALSLLILSASAHGTNLLERTAILALKTAKASTTGTTNEHGGMLIERSSKLIEFVEPTPEGNPTSVTVIDKKQLHWGDRIVGTYHVHLCMAGYYHQYFSVQDVVVAIFSGVPEFMLDECTGDVHEFDPHQDKIHDTGIDGHIVGPHCELLIRHIPEGRIIGNINEIEPEHAGPAVDNNVGDCP